MSAPSKVVNGEKFKYIAKTQNWLSFKIKPNIAGLQSQNYYSPIPETSPITGMKIFI